jgi:hypothetical protein
MFLGSIFWGQIFGVKEHLRFTNLWKLKKIGVQNVWGQKNWEFKFVGGQMICVIKFGVSKFLEVKK